MKVEVKGRARWWRLRDSVLESARSGAMAAVAAVAVFMGIVLLMVATCYALINLVWTDLPIVLKAVTITSASLIIAGLAALGLGMIAMSNAPRTKRKDRREGEGDDDAH